MRLCASEIWCLEHIPTSNGIWPLLYCKNANSVTSFLFLTTFCGLNALDLLRIIGSKLGNNLQHRRIIGGILEHKGKE